MKSATQKFLDFNGTNIPVMSADGTIYVAIRPICKALGVNYKHQHESISKDEILGRVSCNHGIHDTTNRVQEMFCLPEMYIYGWLFSINSKSEELIKYKRECYEVLFNYFHGATTERIELLRTKSQEEILLEEAEALLKSEMMALESYQKVKQLKLSIGGRKQGLVLNDEKLLENQLKLFDL